MSMEIFGDAPPSVVSLRERVLHGAEGDTPDASFWLQVTAHRFGDGAGVIAGETHALLCRVDAAVHALQVGRPRA